MSKISCVLLHQRQSKAEDLLQRIGKQMHVNGMRKLQKKVVAESHFLASLKEKRCDELSLQDHLKSSNLAHLEAILTCAEHLKSVTSVLKKFSYSSGESMTSEVVVDVEGQDGKLWIKVFARNPLALHRIWEGLGQYGDKDVCKLAKEYQNAAIENVIDFLNPKIAFLFACGVTNSVAEDLEQMDIKVIGQRINDPEHKEKVGPLRGKSFDDIESSVKSDILSFQLTDCSHYSINKVNLDITTLIALVSSLTNGDCFLKFKDVVLNTQAEEERAEPLLPILNSFMQGKDLFVCKTALKDFNKILSTIGGEKELERANELMKKLTVVDDCPSTRALELVESASIKIRSKVIFGTGDTLQALTSTANRSFVRGAHDQGVDFSVFYHSSRALTEKKEATAMKDLN